MHALSGTECKISGWTQLFQEISILYRKMFVEEHTWVNQRVFLTEIKLWVTSGFSMCLESQLKPFSTAYFRL